MKGANLVISRPFLPTFESDELDCFFYFIDIDNIDEISVVEVCKAYETVYIEKTVYEVIKDLKVYIRSSIVVIEDIVRKNEEKSEELRVAFLASSDTHVHFMKQLSDEFRNHLYIIPSPDCKNEGADVILQDMGEEYVEINYKMEECEKLLEFNPVCIFCGADWTSEYAAVKRIIQNKNIRMIALQEGPEDWHFRIARENRFKVLNHYRNADIIFAEGAKTLNYIRPKYFAVTGNPKISSLDLIPLPKKPRVMINCNFTYLETKPAYESVRESWIKSVIKVCKKIGVDYVISIHPRDDSTWSGEPSVRSNAFVLKEELVKSSIIISRFSTVIYEALACGREAVYYNIHFEPMATFQDEEDLPILCVKEEVELENILQKHVSEYPVGLDKEKISVFLNRHISKLDGQSVNRIANGILGIAENIIDFSEEFVEKIGRQCIVIKHDTEWFSHPLNNVMVILYDEETNYFDKGLKYAEYLADEGKHVLLITPCFSKKFRQYMIYQNHQSIEIIPTKSYQIDLNGICVSKIYITNDLSENKTIIKNIRISKGAENAEISIIQ